MSEGRSIALDFSRLTISLLALRLITAALLLPPWAGFDEPYHHGYVEKNSERVQWPSFREIGLPERLVEEIRRWPMPPGYASGFSARQYGEKERPPVRPFRDTNYETQQSPMYYAAAGSFLRILPRIAPIAELYLLRLLNAALAFGVGILIMTLVAGERFGWLPIALLALIPGYGVAMSRVANDALCAFLVSAAVAGTLIVGKGGWRATTGALAAGLAPWAKLYGLAVLPGSAIREATRRQATVRARVLRVALVVAPTLLLIFFSMRFLGHPFPAMYNIREARFAAFSEVPWIRDLWTVAKSHIWISGMSFLVFPTWIYVVALVPLGVGLLLTFSAIPSSRREYLGLLSAPIVVFGLALAYHNWRAFGYYRGGGGTGGWYVWAVALPEMLLLAEGIRRRVRLWKWTIPALAIFLLLTVLADAALFFDSTGLLLRTARGHITGVAPASVSQIVSAYLGSRPAIVAMAAVVLAVASWLVAAFLLLMSVRNKDDDLRGTAIR